MKTDDNFDRQTQKKSRRERAKIGVKTGVFSCSFLEELLVQEEDEQINVDLCLIEHLHHGHTVVLQLQKILRKQQNTR